MKAFCICLPEQPEAIERARVHFDTHGLPGVDFFWGINAPVAGLSTSHTYEIDHPGSGFIMGPQPVGCWLSHYMLWSCLLRANADPADAAKLSRDDHFLVLEVDAKLCDDFPSRLKQALADAPLDFDFLYIGSCCVAGRAIAPANPGCLGSEASARLASPETPPGVYACKQMLCTHGYVVARRCLPLVLRTLRRIWAPIDIQLTMEAFPQLKTYVVLPRMIEQFDTELPP